MAKARKEQIGGWKEEWVGRKIKMKRKLREEYIEKIISWDKKLCPIEHSDSSFLLYKAEKGRGTFVE